LRTITARSEAERGAAEIVICGSIVERRRVEIKGQGRAERRGNDVVVAVLDDGRGRVAVAVAVFGDERGSARVSPRGGQKRRHGSGGGGGGRARSAEGLHRAAHPARGGSLRVVKAAVVVVVVVETGVEKRIGGGVRIAKRV